MHSNSSALGIRRCPSNWVSYLGIHLDTQVVDIMTSLATHHNIAIAYQNLDNMDESRSHLQCALTAVTLRNGKYYTTEIKVLKALALSYEKPNEWASVAHFFQRILDLPLRHTPNHPIVSKIRNALSNAENKINKSLPTL
ncbi:unnamed protein product [Rotaria socialis]